MAEGLLQYEAVIGIKQNTEADLRAAITAAATTQSAFDMAPSAKGSAASAQDQAHFMAKHLIANARSILCSISRRTILRSMDRCRFLYTTRPLCPKLCLIVRPCWLSSSNFSCSTQKCRIRHSE